MSMEKIAEAYSKIDYRKPAQQKVITAKEMGISINGHKTAKSNGPTALQRMAQGYKDHKEKIEAQAKEQAEKNKRDHEKAMKTLKENTKGAEK